MGVQSRYPWIKIKPISHFTSTRFSTFSFYYDVWSNRTRTFKKYFTGFLLFRKNFSVKYLEFRIVPNRTEKSFTVRSLYIWWLLLLFLYKTLKFFFLNYWCRCGPTTVLYGTSKGILSVENIVCFKFFFPLEWCWLHSLLP